MSFAYLLVIENEVVPPPSLDLVPSGEMEPPNVCVFLLYFSRSFVLGRVMGFFTLLPTPRLPPEIGASRWQILIPPVGWHLPEYAVGKRKKKPTAEIRNKKK
ncbi:hypothetical protein AVEN_181372-1 [Araneus ventricosus]|uniref:Uncharacterized protein n=1 Tax=Araneus ventricosus TaxID=182803 RepID=A0A4Y2HPE9_ARAVE|nr:hypothetical protein AVEN_181372-1 [Araneus ventricosus]